MATVISHDFECPKKFLNSLVHFSEVGPNWERERDGCFIFRGIENIKHKLIPAALRSKKMHPQKFNQLWGIASCGLKDFTPGDPKFQRYAELEVIRRFYQHADLAGINLPTVEYRLREYLLAPADLAEDVRRFEGIYPHRWPQRELLPIYALAQHYELPTRLLDWSRDPFVAAYFAAKKAIGKSTTLGVWAFFSNFLIEDRVADTPSHSVRLVTAPASQNPNLAAQRGVFTVAMSASDKEAKRPLHELLPDDIHMSRHTLPAREAVGLLGQLRNLGYTCARIFPGFAGAAEAVNELSMINGEVGIHFPQVTPTCSVGAWKTILKR